MQANNKTSTLSANHDNIHITLKDFETLKTCS